MDKFPTEILNNIFNHLHQTEKLECMLVCRHWAQSCLLNTVAIFSTNYDSDTAIARFNSLIKTLEQNPSKSKQVQHLLLKDCMDFEFDGSILGSRFPHLRFLFLSNTYVGQDPFTVSQLEQFDSWKDYLEKIIENETALFTFSFLQAGVFNCLTMISLSPDRESVPAPISEGNFKSLKNAPLLSVLKLEGLSFPLQYIELIHENAPKLKHLSLKQIFLDEEEVHLPKTISPINYMKTLCVRDCSLTLSMQYTWIKYITQKYTCLSEFTFECSTDINEGDIGTDYIDYAEYNEHVTSPLVLNLGRQLKLFHMDSTYLTPEFFEELDNNEYRLQDIKLKPTRTPLFLEKFFHHSNQTKYIQSLTLTYLTNFDNFQLLENITHLKTLNLDFSSKYNSLVDNIHKSPLFFNKLIKHCPIGLESLSISSILIEIEHGLSPVHPTQLKSVKFTSAKIESGVTDFISATFPQLNNISLINCATPVLELVLPNHNLISFEIVGYYVSSTLVLVKSGETLYYIVPEEKEEDPIKYCRCENFTKDISSFYNISKPVPFQQVNLKLRTQLICRSVRAVFINGKLAQ